MLTNPATGNTSRAEQTLPIHYEAHNLESGRVIVAGVDDSPVGKEGDSNRANVSGGEHVRKIEPDHVFMIRVVP